MDLLGAVLRYRRLVIVIAFAFAIGVAALLLSRPRTYTASASFTPQATRPPMGSLGGLAAQLGVLVPGSELNQSPAFYADLLRSRAILEPLVQVPVRLDPPNGTISGTFIDLQEVGGADSANKRENAIKTLRKLMYVDVAQRTGVIRLDVKTRYPRLSTVLADSALGLLNSFNVETRRSQAAAQRQFLEQRLARVSAELANAEEALREFSQRNRGDINNAPQLMIEQRRLERTLSMRTQVYSGLVQGLEQAKLDEIRDTPLLTVIEQPTLPVRADPRGLAIKSILAFAIGLFLGAVAALLKYAFVANRRARPESFAELSAEFAAAKSDLLRIVRPRKRASIGSGTLP